MINTTRHSCGKSWFRWMMLTPSLLVPVVAAPFISSPARADIPTLGEIKVKTDAQRQAIRSIRLTERETIDVEPRDDAEAEARDHMVAAQTESGLPSGHLDVDGSLTVMRLNNHLDLTVVREIDRRVSKARLGMTDARNTAELAQTHQLSPRAASGLDQSRIVILDGEKEVRIPNGRSVAAVMKSPEKRLAQELSMDRLGLLPEWVFDERYSVNISQVTGSTFRLTGHHESQLAFEAIVDRALDYRVQSIRVYSEGQFVQVDRSYSDYRRAHDMWIPWSFEERIQREASANAKLTSRQLEAFEVNIDFQPDIFSIPEGFRVQHVDITPQ